MRKKQRLFMCLVLFHTHTHLPVLKIALHHGVIRKLDKRRKLRPFEVAGNVFAFQEIATEQHPHVEEKVGCVRKEKDKIVVRE